LFQIKICGITSAEDALLAAQSGADAIGLNFYEQSPRHVTSEQAAEIVGRLREDFSPEAVQVVALFVNHGLDDILWTIRDADLYGPGLCLQLHGDEPPELLRDLHGHELGTSGQLLQATGHAPVVPVIRALRVASGDLAMPAAYLEACRRLSALPQAVLLDAARPGSYGGTGKTIDWPAIGANGGRLGVPLILAGGLTQDNVAGAIAAARPAAVDVASGVESSPGKKDASKMQAFVKAAQLSFLGLDS
jgi:phosphoribosylanthranilate isomerase